MEMQKRSTRRVQVPVRRRIQVSRLRYRGSCVLRLVRKLRAAYQRILVSIASAGSGRFAFKSLCATKSACACHSPTTSSRPSFTRSNSFYAEAISDCLDFIKRNSAMTN